MLRRVLLKEPSKDEPKQRRALFRVKCKIQGKVCKVIVDSRSSENIILEEETKIFHLLRIPHAHPYRVTWLNKGHTILINEQVWVYFLIGAIKIRYFVMCYPWMLVICSWVDLGNMIGMLFIMARRTFIPSRRME